MKRRAYPIDSFDLLSRLPDGTTSLVYFDPPWYRPDRYFAEETGTHDLEAYLKFIRSRIAHAHRALATGGFFVYHTDPPVQGSVRSVIDDIFGSGNFLYEAILPGSPSFSLGTPRAHHKSLLFYGKDASSILDHPTRSLDEIEISRRYPALDKKGRFRYGDLFTRANDKQSFEWRGIAPPDGRTWRYGRDRLEQLHRAGQIELGGGSLPRLKQYASKVETVHVGSVWNDLDLFIKKSDRTGHPAQQSLSLFERVFDMTNDRSGLFVDPFCGSGSALIVAEARNIDWIACDIEPGAIDLTNARLGSEPASQSEIRKFLARSQFELDQAFDPHDEAQQNDDTRTMTYDVFVSHASEDKSAIARPIADKLVGMGFRVWYDEFSLKIGDSLRESIDRGLSSSRYGLVIISKHFFSKKWTQRELSALVARSMESGNLILPIWHEISKNEILDNSPALVDIYALNTSTHTLDEIAAKLEEKLGSA